MSHHAAYSVTEIAERKRTIWKIPFAGNIFSVAGPQQLREMVTEAMCLVVRCALAIHMHGIKESRIIDAFRHLLETLNVSVSLVK